MLVVGWLRFAFPPGTGTVVDAGWGRAPESAEVAAESKGLTHLLVPPISRKGRGTCTALLLRCLSHGHTTTAVGRT